MKIECVKIQGETQVNMVQAQTDIPIKLAKIKAQSTKSGIR
ncbi:hypothetical protein DJ66_0224 [Candidatus Liberibacter solanacearum]|uniref:Uncharacterized protein n=1 Tax=Candidatus Liberibacter solanacearum TaxID=556287 RepID=A0A0F4VMV2_9HYPH|nr:hypothetical protein [Candidatus Liberibacter solanacearum]KJZ82615.1 hypothetical protein DJ66_0224 [Candidatus Liberibacter solanacearum]